MGHSGEESVLFFKSCLFKTIFLLFCWAFHTLYFDPIPFSYSPRSTSISSSFDSTAPFLSFVLSPVCAAHTHLGVGPSPAAWLTDQRLRPLWKLTLPLLAVSTANDSTVRVTERTEKGVHSAHTEAHLCTRVHVHTYTHASHLLHLLLSRLFICRTWHYCHCYVSQKVPLNFLTCHFGGHVGVSFLSSLP